MICPNDEEQAQHDGECDPNFHSIIKPRISGLFPSHDSGTKILTYFYYPSFNPSALRSRLQSCVVIGWNISRRLELLDHAMVRRKQTRCIRLKSKWWRGAAVAAATKVINETNAYRCVLSYYISSVQVIVKINARQESSQNQNSRTLCA